MNILQNWPQQKHQWKRPAERQRYDIEKIVEKLRSVKSLGKYSDDLLKDLARFSYYEELSQSIVLFRQGDMATDWYIILAGTVDVVISNVGLLDIGGETLVKRLSVGTLFGEHSSVDPHSCSAIISKDSELLRIGQRDFRTLWRQYSGSIRDTVVILSHLVSKYLGYSVRNKQQPIRNNLVEKLGYSGENNHFVPLKTDNPDYHRVPRPPPHRRKSDHLLSEKFAPDYNDIPHSQKLDSTDFRINDRQNQYQENVELIRNLRSCQVDNYRENYDFDPIYDSTPYDCVMENGAAPCLPETFNPSDEEIWSRGTPENFLPNGDIRVDPLFRENYEIPHEVDQEYHNGVMDHNGPHATASTSTNFIEMSRSMSTDSKIYHCGRVLRAVMLLGTPTMIQDRRLSTALYRRCMVGSELVDWLIDKLDPPVCATRIQASGMWQALLEHGVLMHVSHEYSFADKPLFYRWNIDEGSPGVVVKFPTLKEQHQAEMELGQVLSFLSTIGPDASFRMILQKPPLERSSEELDLVYEELLHVKALAHLSTMVKRELAAVLILEQHSHAGTVLFNQGEEGKSWYILLKGSVNVVIYGKGVVCTLHEGDDFGKLALVNDAPRAATIIMREDNSQFLRVDKHDFNRILRDVEANTVRLKEHGEDVLVLEKIPVYQPADLIQNMALVDVAHHHRYSVMAGTPEKMLEYLLETRIDSHKDDFGADTLLEDFILTHIIFMPLNVLCNSLTVYYQQGCSVSGPNLSLSAFPPNLRQAQTVEQKIIMKKRVVSFLKTWISVAGVMFFQDAIGAAFVEELYCLALEDTKSYPELVPDLRILEELKCAKEQAMLLTTRGCKIVMDCGVLRSDCPLPVLPFDICIFNVHSVDQSYITMKTAVNRCVREIVLSATQKLGLGPDGTVELVEVKSNGERRVYHPNDISVSTMSTLNGIFFVCFTDQVDALLPLPEQRGPIESIHSATLDLMCSSELAYHLAMFHWDLFFNTHEYELIYQIVGRDRFPGKVPTNLDLLIRRFSEVQFWVVTETLLCHNMTKRVHILRKFIKIAAQAKVYQDFLTFYAVILGLSNVAISRLSHTWDKLPAKFRKQFVYFESFLDPSRNHRAYRLMVSKLHPPVIPFLPLMLKDLTFTHEGNKTYFDGMVNFEKMHMISQTLRAFRYYKTKHFEIDGFSFRDSEAQQLIRNFKVIDNQRMLIQLSHKLEPPGRNKHYH